MLSFSYFLRYFFLFLKTVKRKNKLVKIQKFHFFQKNKKSYKKTRSKKRPKNTEQIYIFYHLQKTIFRFSEKIPKPKIHIKNTEKIKSASVLVKYVNLNLKSAVFRAFSRDIARFAIWCVSLYYMLFVSRRSF